MRKIIKIQFFILLVGSIFAWSNFTIELFDWLNNKACTTGCSATGEVVNPFLTPCFYGALFFALAFILSILLFIGSREKKAKPEIQAPKPEQNTGQTN
ncbi:hypothetical protein DRH27_04540 [Candidatus Falkowbacteria bacterium]|nr:MAG: hypothetical protein DRH27_04540 [Candidatus Falkowbacteria bacterium]